MISTESIVFRAEQEEAIDFTVTALKRSRKVLWNAKMRFGKTLCAIEVAHRLGYRRTLVLTHRPAVRQEWFDSIEKLQLEGWTYGSRTTSAMSEDERKRRGASFAELEDAAKDKDTHYVYFASMQDLRSSKRVNQQKGIVKNDDVFSAKWDFLIVDEAHEGITTRLGNDVIAELQKRRSMRTLYLSGTPYSIRQNFDTADVYNWDYCMEQRAKEQWDSSAAGTPNPYANMARMNILTYNLRNTFAPYFLTDNEGFNFAEFFRVDEAQMCFVHEADVRKFVSLLATAPQYPFANEALSQSLCHTLWYMPGVNAARCLAQILTEQTAENPFRCYKVINVAGDGVSSQTSPLEEVKTAISSNERTITLSCGRLTTGVSIPEWTAVFMLAGSAETGCAHYFQTIFRCQSPYREGMKAECYTFDFSPVRTLTAIDQYISNNLATTDHEARVQKLTEFLHYCPTIIVDGGKRNQIDTETFIRYINTSYSTSLIRNGFHGDCLYTDLNNLGKNDIRLLEEVAEAMANAVLEERRQRSNDIQAAKKPAKKAKIKAAENAEKQNEATAAQSREAAAMARLTPRQRAIAILSQISTRFPIMIYGTVDNIEGLTIDSFLRNIDAESWRHFMPRGITMQLFKRLKHLYREDIFVATAKAIVARLRHADTLAPDERVAEIANILSDFSYPDRETILTPWNVVNRHLSDTLGGYCFFDDKFEKPLAQTRFVYNEGVTNRTLMNPNAQILDICSKTGLYSLYVAYSLYKVRSSQSQGLFDMLSDQESCSMWKEVVEHNVFAVCKTAMAACITRRTLVGFDSDVKPNIITIPDLNSQVIVYKTKLANTLSDPRNYPNTSTNQKMKFDAIIGNPPYQMNIGEKKDNYGIPLYNQFVDIARQIRPQFITMITPSRWFTGGRGLDQFRQSMLGDTHIRAIFDYVDSKDCFPTVDISGGVSYFLWDAKHKTNCQFTNHFGGNANTLPRKLDEFNIFVRNNGALSLIHKVKAMSKTMLNAQISPQTPFGFVSTYRGTAQPETDPTCVMLKSSGDASYVLREDIKKNQQWIDLHKVIFSKATCEHAGTPDRNGQYRVLSALALLQPQCVCTQSYLVAGAYATAEEAENLLTYLKTKFVRYLILQTITSQDLSPEKFMFVPLQNFTSKSDINWSATVEEIDKQLYEKYGVDEAERSLIENTIKEM